MAKRAFDLLVSVTALLALWPLLLLIGLLVRLDSSGPALFRQERIGRFGQPFEILKFRTMWSESRPGGPLITVAGDRRTTRVGRWLRASKLDELPQLLNVMAGDMSLVGPRPEVAKYVALYPPSDRELVLSIWPGITDEAAVEFRDEGDLLAAADDPERCYVEEILPRKLHLYGDYVRQRSFSGDLQVLWRTFLAILGLPTSKSR
jgi:lipopolysaccharide/colanic/teichoic acid biosynthesis glycosyltransferase